jgi:cation diffusion facilitator family transporter
LTHRNPEANVMGEKSEPLKKGEEAARLSTIILVALAVLKGITSLASGSIALLAGTIDSFSDVFSSIAVWAGLKIAKKKPSERFPYGYYKAETFAALTVSLIIMASSILIMVESVQKPFEVYVISFSYIALAVAAISAVVCYLLAKYKTRLGHQIGSQALTSEGLHSMVDVYTSLLVFAGVFLSVFGYQVGEALVGFIIGAYVLARGFLFGKDAALILMDVSPDPKRIKDMEEIALSVPGVTGTHEVRLRKSGPVFFGEMHVELQDGLSLKRAHVISEEVEDRIKERFKDIELVTVHAGLGHSKKTRVAIPIVENKGLDSLTSIHFGSALCFAFVDVEEDHIVNFYVKDNEGANLERRKGIQAANMLMGEKVDAAIVDHLGEGPFNILGNNLVTIYYLSKPTTVGEAVHLLNQDLLEKMKSPTEKTEWE